MSIDNLVLVVRYYQDQGPQVDPSALPEVVVQASLQIFIEHEEDQTVLLFEDLVVVVILEEEEDVAAAFEHQEVLLMVLLC